MTPLRDKISKEALIWALRRAIEILEKSDVEEYSRENRSFNLTKIPGLDENNTFDLILQEWRAGLKTNEKSAD